jgi:ubiquitin-protein ligase
LEDAYIFKELDDLIKNSIEGISIQPDEQNAFHITATIDGPSESVYEKGMFKLDIVFP